MNKNYKNVKGTFSNIRPSDECIERITDMTKNKSKKQIKLAPALALAACLAILVTGILGGSALTARINPIKVTDNITQGTPSANYFFTITAYAEEGENVDITKSGKYTMQDLKIKSYYDDDGNYTVETICDSAFEVTGENIKSVRYQCLNGDFGICIDQNKIL